MAASSAILREVRWRVTGTTAWSDIATCSPVAELRLEGLDRDKTYDVQIRDVSACGAKSDWVLHTAVVPDVAPGNITLSDLSAAAASALYPAANMVPNTSGENGTAGWSGSTAISSLSATDGYQLRAAAPGASGTNTFYTDLIPVTAGKPYTASADVLADAAATGTYYIDVLYFNSSGGTVTDGSNGVFAADGAWHRPTVTDTPAAGAVTARVRVVATGAIWTTLAWRRVKFEQGSTATAFSIEAAAAAAQAEANAASADAATALNQLTDIASDGKLTADEKVQSKQRYNTLTAEQSGIDAQATSYGITTEKTNYDGAITALKNYLKTTVGVLDASFVWTGITGTTAITRATWDSNWTTVYTAKTALLNAIYAAAKSKADAAQSTANTAVTNAAMAQTAANNAQTAANTANSALASIASDNVLSAGGEKSAVIQDYAVITSEQAGIDAQATTYAITTEKTAYDNAVSALTAYLGTLTAPTAWNSQAGNTTITGTTFRSKFSDVYTTRQALLNAIYAAAKSKADAAQATANTATGQVSQLPVINGGFDIAPTGYGWTADSGSGWTIDTAGNTPGIGPNSALHPAGSGGVRVYRNGGLAACNPGQVYKTQALVKAVGANGSCYIAVSWCNASGGEITTTPGNQVTGTTTAGSFAVGAAPAGTVYARTILVTNGHTAGTYYVDNVACTQYPSSLDEVPDGTTKFGAIYNPTAQTGIAQPGQNLMPNPTGALGFSGLPGFSWVGGSQQQMATRTELFGNAGPMFACVNPGTGSVDQGFTTTIPQAASSVPVTISADMDPRMVATGTMIVQLRFMNSSGTEIDSGNRPIIVATNGQPMKRYTATATTAAGTASIQLVVRFSGTMSSSSVIGWRNIKLELGSVATPYQDNATQFGNLATVPNGGVKAYADFGDNTAGGHAGKNVDNISDGGTYARIKGIELSGGLHKLGVASSGAVLGNQLNAPNSLTLNYGAARNTTALTAYSTGAVDVNAFNVSMGGATVSYSAVTSAVTGLTQGHTYQIYCRDPGGAGGSKTWFAVEGSGQALLALGYDDAVLGGQVTIPSSGSSGGGGLIDGCVCADMLLRDGLTAGDLARGWRWWHWVFRPRLLCSDGKRRFVRYRPRIIVAPAVRITAPSGATLDCSVTTPFTLRDGMSAMAPDMTGGTILTDDGWFIAQPVQPIGLREVVRISVGGHSFFAGAKAHQRISSHNGIKK
jgi:hypothetical protein